MIVQRNRIGHDDLLDGFHQLLDGRPYKRMRKRAAALSQPFSQLRHLEGAARSHIILTNTTPAPVSHHVHHFLDVAFSSRLSQTQLRGSPDEIIALRNPRAFTPPYPVQPRQAAAGCHIITVMTGAAYK